MAEVGKTSLVINRAHQAADAFPDGQPGVATCSVVIAGRRYLPGLAVHNALLETSEDPETAVRTAFSRTYRGLTETEADAFRAIGSHPGRPAALDAEQTG